MFYLIELTPLSIPHVKLTCNPQKKTVQFARKLSLTSLQSCTLCRLPAHLPAALLLLLTPHAMTPLFLEHCEIIAITFGLVSNMPKCS